MINFPKIIVGLSIMALITTVSSIFIASKLIHQRTKDAQNQSLTNVLPATSGAFTASQVLSHSTPSDCWMIIDQKVYDLTKFLVSHPGGAIVMTPYCGRDGTTAYRTKDRTPATTHSQEADNLLPQFYLGPLGSDQILPSSNPTQNPSPTPKKVLSSAVSNSQVASHATSADCWLTISGQVYSVSSYLAIHPGGASVISPYCGKDATNAFNSKDKSPGVTHSAYAQSLLANYLVGGIALPTKIPLIVLTQTTVSQSLTSSTVASHSTSSDCWVTISNNIYNLTNYLVQHPGGVGAITPYCGKDGTNAFQTRGGNGQHSSFAYSLLNNYLIGSLGSSVTVASTTSPSSPTSSPSVSSSCTNLPSSICSLYPDAIKKSGNYEDNGSWEGKISTSTGVCREIKVSSSGSISEDKSC